MQSSCKDVAEKMIVNVWATQKQHNQTESTVSREIEILCLPKVRGTERSSVLQGLTPVVNSALFVFKMDF